MAASILLVACLFMIAISSCAALDYTVGESAGWGLGVDFAAWSSDKTFHIEDKLVFQYGPGHTVAEVGVEDYTTCTAGNSVDTHKSGPTEIPLMTPGTHYFICTVTGHCAAGMKFGITVSIPGELSAAPAPPSITPPSPPAQMIYSHASATPLSYGTLAILFLLLAINQIC